MLSDGYGDGMVQVGNHGRVELAFVALDRGGEEITDVRAHLCYVTIAIVLEQGWLAGLVSRVSRG